MARKEVVCFQKNLEVLCKEHGRIQEVASAAGVSRVFLSRVIHGHAVPTIEIALRIADAVGVSLSDLLSTRQKISA